MNFCDYLDITYTVEEKDRIEATMPIHEGLYQPFGFLHGGVTIAFLETIASRGPALWCDLDKVRPFGVDVHVRHRKPGKQGLLRGTAVLTRTERNTQYWDMVARDDEGDVVSEGTLIAKIVSLEYLAEKEAKRAAARAERDARATHA